jgi:hypothetical protein
MQEVFDYLLDVEIGLEVFILIVNSTNALKLAHAGRFFSLA